MNFAPIAIAVEKVIAKNEMEIMIEKAKDWPSRYTPVVASALIAAEAAKHAAEFNARVHECYRRYGNLDA